LDGIGLWWRWCCIALDTRRESWLAAPSCVVVVVVVVVSHRVHREVSAPPPAHGTRDRDPTNNAVRYNPHTRQILILPRLLLLLLFLYYTNSTEDDDESRYRRERHASTKQLSLIDHDLDLVHSFACRVARSCWCCIDLLVLVLVLVLGLRVE